MRAGTGCQKSAVFYKLHGSQVDLSVPFHRILYRISGFCKSRWIQNHNVKLFSSFLQLRKKFKYILTDKLHRTVKSVQLRIGRRLIYSKLRGVYSGYSTGACNSRIQSKKSVWVKQSSTFAFLQSFWIARRLYF